MPKKEPIKKFDELTLDEMRQRLVQSSTILWKPTIVLYPEARKVTPKIKFDALIADWQILQRYLNSIPEQNIEELTIYYRKFQGIEDPKAQGFANNLFK